MTKEERADRLEALDLIIHNNSKHYELVAKPPQPTDKKIRPTKKRAREFSDDLVELIVDEVALPENENGITIKFLAWELVKSPEKLAQIRADLEQQDGIRTQILSKVYEHIYYCIEIGLLSLEDGFLYLN